MLRVFTTFLLKHLFVIGFCAFVNSAHADDEQLLPIDEADRDLNFLEFRNTLQQIVGYKSPEELVKYLHPGLLNGMNAPKGAAEFAKKWRIDAIDSTLWKELDDVLSLGGGFVRSNKGAQFCAPYVYTNFPEDYDLKTHAAITADRVYLMSEPKFSAQRVMQLNYNIVRVIDWEAVADADGDASLRWLPVMTLTGQRGYVLREVVRSPLDYHACFLLGKKTGWKLHTFTRIELP